MQEHCFALYLDRGAKLGTRGSRRHRDGSTEGKPSINRTFINQALNKALRGRQLKVILERCLA